MVPAGHCSEMSSHVLERFYHRLIDRADQITHTSKLPLFVYCEIRLRCVALPESTALLSDFIDDAGTCFDRGVHLVRRNARCDLLYKYLQDIE